MSNIPSIRTAPRRQPAKSVHFSVLSLLACLLIAQLLTLWLVILQEYRYRDQQRAAQELIEHLGAIQYAQPVEDHQAQQKRLQAEQAEVFKAIQECFDDI